MQIMTENKTWGWDLDSFVSEEIHVKVSNMCPEISLKYLLHWWKFNISQIIFNYGYLPDRWWNMVKYAHSVGYLPTLHSGLIS